VPLRAGPVSRLSVLLKRDRAAAPGQASFPEASIPDAVAQILADNRTRFLRFLERRVGRRDLAEEILQDALLRGLQRARTLEAQESAVAWFYRLLRNALVDHYRHQDSERRALAAVAAAPPPDRAESAQPDAELMSAVCDCVNQLLATLKPPYADAIRRVDMNGDSVTDLAQAAGITPGNAAVRLHRARQAMRRRIEESCGPCAEHHCLDCECRHEANPGR
jgi:RNA polymerase sigma factor (sigma-70 family)